MSTGEIDTGTRPPADAFALGGKVASLSNCALPSFATL
jgi:hypothetical protein